MLKFIILLLINITLASKTFILSVDLPSNCNYTTINSIPEFCTYNYNIIKNYNTICNKKVIIPNIGCSIDNKNRYVIYNLYIVKNNITILSDTYNTIYTNIRYINILSDIKFTEKAKTYLNGLNIRLYDNITLSYITIDRVRFLEVDYYVEVYGTMAPTLLPTLLPSQKPTEPTILPSITPSEYPTQEPTAEPTQDPTRSSFNLGISQNNHPFTNDVAQVSINNIQFPYDISITDFQETSTSITITLSGFAYPYDKLNGNWVIYTTFIACSINNIDALSKPTDIYWDGLNSYYQFLTQDYCTTGPVSLIYLSGLSIA